MSGSASVSASPTTGGWAHRSPTPSSSRPKAPTCCSTRIVTTRSSATACWSKRPGSRVSRWPTQRLADLLAALIVECSERSTARTAERRLRNSYGIAVCGIGRYSRAILEAAQSPSASAESPGHLQRPTVRMHLAVLKNQRRAKQSGRTGKIAVVGAVAPKYAGIARLKRNDVLLGSVKNRFCDTAAVHRVVGQDHIGEM